MVVISRLLVLLLLMQSVPITTNVVRSIPAQARYPRYNNEHYVIKFVSDLTHVGGFLRLLQFPPAIKLTATI